jgi:hypothetical protein
MKIHTTCLYVGAEWTAPQGWAAEATADPVVSEVPDDGCEVVVAGLDEVVIERDEPDDVVVEPEEDGADELHPAAINATAAITSRPRALRARTTTTRLFPTAAKPN